MNNSRPGSKHGLSLSGEYFIIMVFHKAHSPLVYSQKGVDFRYFRYVDDIRLFAKNENDLRRLLVSLDLLSKDIGLFPQSSKISIEKINDIEKELKSVSNPPEPAIKKMMVNQKKLFQRIVELTAGFTISDTTRFKYLLAHAEPSAAMTNRLWRILEKHPAIYKSACNYLRRYPKLPRVPTEYLVIRAKRNQNRFSGRV